MPVVPAGDLALLRTQPQTSKLYLIVQASERWVSSTSSFNTDDFVWWGTVQAAPAADPVFSLSITTDAAAPGVKLFDRMLVLVSSVGYGHWDRCVLATHGDQTVVGGGAVDVFYVAVTSEASEVQVGDYVVVLDDFRFQLRFPKVTESAGDLTWYKDYGYFKDSIGEAGGDIALTWDQLDPLGSDATRRQASMPPVPIMGSHVVQFIDPDVGSVDIDFDWSDSYSITSGVAVDAWASWGETDHVGGFWNSALENPAAQTYNNISGLRGFKVWLEPSTDGTDMATAELRRGIRWVFTLRKPEDYDPDTDPDDACPITDFALESLSGSFASGGWQASIRVYNSQASEYTILPGALVVLFTEDAYGSASGSIGPDYFTLVGRENILFTGYIADDSITRDSETGDVTFDVLSLAELMKRRENYPVPIESDGAADEWYKAEDLTVDRAAHHYLTWHTTLKLLADVYETGDDREVKAMDFLAGDAYSTIDQFLWDRLFARLLCDRFGRFSMEIDRQMEAAGGGTTMWTLASGDWMGEAQAEQIIEFPTSTVDLGGLIFGDGDVTPILSHAPGEMSRYTGTPDQMTSLALTDQDELNTLSGRLLAYRNNEWPRLTIQQGNWRVADIWPQEYAIVSENLLRHTFSSDYFIGREYSYEYDPQAGALYLTSTFEMETDGPPGTTVTIPDDIPNYTPPPPPPPPWIPPEGGGGGEDTGRRIIATDVGVFVTDDIGEVNPYWYAVNTGVTSARLRCFKILRDPWHWWTSGGAERTLWGMFTQTGGWYAGALGTGVPFYLYKHEDFPNGTWELSYSASELGGGLGHWQLTDMVGSIETEDKWYLSVHQHTGGLDAGPLYCVSSVDGGDNWVTQGAYAVGGAADWVGYCGWYGNVSSYGLNLVGRLAMANHGAGARLYGYYEQRPGNVLRVMRSVNSGAAWNATGAPNGIGGGVEPIAGIAVPYVNATWPDSDLVISDQVAAIAAGIQRSTDSAATWTDVSGAGTGYRVIFGGVCPNDRLTMAFICNATAAQQSKVILTHDGGATWTTWKAMAYYSSPGGLIQWTGSSIQNILLFLKAPQASRSVRLLTENDDIDKTGNLFGVGSVTDISRCERDSMGAA